MSEEIRLNSSKLGTKEYWNNFYKKEIANFEDNEEDTGECWFDDSDAELKMIQFLIDKINEEELPFGKPENIKIVDLGTGNGHLLFQLHEDILEECAYQDEIKFDFKGIDYSPDSVEFAIKIAEQKYPQAAFQFEQVDLLTKENKFLLTNSSQFDILLDKGTLDAIALNQNVIPEFDNKIGMDIYASQVSQLMHENSILLITSCNFTESELIKIITQDKSNCLTVWSKIEYPSFQFGGVKGSTICSIAFIKN
ncbi:unnamed protein product [Debaryomyces fabryi]|nr:unnamed protein product [Debaryomyces fabryi]